jgi:hypothetical protein
MFLSKKLIEIIYEIIFESVKFEKKNCKLCMGAAFPITGQANWSFLKRNNLPVFNDTTCIYSYCEQL